MSASDQHGRLSPAAKAIYASGDFTSNTVLSALSLIFASYYLIEIAELRPFLAGLVPLIGRFVDAFTDPAMGRLSDVTRWRWGRRRPYFLIGAVPLGLSFALLWSVPPVGSELVRFGYFTVVYCALTVSLTVLSVPYLALLPEMALDYDERTSLNTYRNAASTCGVAAAIGMRPLADVLGGGAAGFAAAGTLVGVLLALPWLAVWKVSFERPNFRMRPVELGFFEGLRVAGKHDAFQTLIGLYLCGRVAIDIMGAMLIVYFTYWIGRSQDFEILMLAFLVAGVVSLPAWLAIARHTDKATLFIVGAVWWAVSLVLLFVADPGWPRWTLFVFAPTAGIGFAVVDLMPWSMVGDVIDEDDVTTGERREGIYNGVFTFLRKLSGALAVFVAFSTLDVLGFVKGQQQTATVLWGIRVLASVVPAACLVLAIGFARRYRLGRHEHARILEILRVRDAGR